MKVKSVEEKRKTEQETVKEMIHIYCRKNHKTKKGLLCPECNELLMYANQRSERCPFMEHKTFCANCKVHCYKPVMREKIKQVMRFSGPRMLLYHPCMTIWHLICSIRDKRESNKKA